MYKVARWLAGHKIAALENEVAQLASLRVTSTLDILAGWRAQRVLQERYGLAALAMFSCQLDLPLLQDGQTVAAKLNRLAVAITEVYDPRHHIAPDDAYYLADGPAASKRPDGTYEFQTKTHPGAVGKVNVRASVLERELYRMNRPLWQDYITARDTWPDMPRLFNDQAAALILYALALDGLFRKPLALAFALLVVDGLAKELTNLVKGMGWNGTLHGATLCEAETLRGRAVGTVDLGVESAARVDTSKLQTYEPDPQQLRRAIQLVLEHELQGERRQIAWEDVDSYWHRRLAYTANGAHHDHRYQLNAVPGIRNTRRSASEQMAVNPLHAWDGSCRYSASLKLEHGKSRALFSADTSSYYCFNHLLTPVERAWANRIVVLDPGRGGTIGIGARLDSGPKGVHTMLDYTDFNSQHSLQAQAMVIEETCKWVNYPDPLAQRLVRSFYQSYIRVGGKLRRVRGTLMSGHRATTYINSVLNRAYLLCAYPPMSSLYAIHVGDDVYLRTPDRATAAAIIAAAATAGIRINPVKQSVGEVTAEFLRCAYSGGEAHMYPARSISSLVSGNWVSEVKLTPESALQSFTRSAWAFENRTGCRGKAAILNVLFREACGLPRPIATELALGRVSVNGGPVRYGGQTVKVVRAVTHTRYAPKQGKWHYPGAYRDAIGPNGRRATNEYITHAMTAMDKAAVEVVGTVPVNSMLRTSYSKAIASSSGSGCPLPLERLRLRTETHHLRVLAPSYIEMMRRRKAHHNPVAGSFIATLLLPTMDRTQQDQFMRVTGVPEADIAEFTHTSTALPTLAMGVIGYAELEAVNVHREAIQPVYAKRRFYV